MARICFSSSLVGRLALLLLAACHSSFAQQEGDWTSYSSAWDFANASSKLDAVSQAQNSALLSLFNPDMPPAVGAESQVGIRDLSRARNDSSNRDFSRACSRCIITFPCCWSVLQTLLSQKTQLFNNWAQAQGLTFPPSEEVRDHIRFAKCIHLGDLGVHARICPRMAAAAAPWMGQEKLQPSIPCMICMTNPVDCVMQPAAFDNFKANMESVFTVNNDPDIKWW